MVEVAGEGLRSVGAASPSKSVYSILPLARHLRAGVQCGVLAFRGGAVQVFTTGVDLAGSLRAYKPPLILLSSCSRSVSRRLVTLLVVAHHPKLVLRDAAEAP